MYNALRSGTQHDALGHIPESEIKPVGIERSTEAVFVVSGTLGRCLFVLFWVKRTHTITLLTTS